MALRIYSSPKKGNERVALIKNTYAEIVADFTKIKDRLGRLVDVEKGFKIIEVMIGMTILGILAALACPYFAG
jgi:prepilin-type N-terminal cleavage/methylation domain-containing protein